MCVYMCVHHNIYIYIYLCVCALYVYIYIYDICMYMYIYLIYVLYYIEAALPVQIENGPRSQCLKLANETLQLQESF